MTFTPENIKSERGKVSLGLDYNRRNVEVTDPGTLQALRDACDRAMKNSIGASKDVELPAYYRIGVQECSKNPDQVEEVIEVLQALEIRQDEIETALEAVDELNIEL